MLSTVARAPVSVLRRVASRLVGGGRRGAPEAVSGMPGPMGMQGVSIELPPTPKGDAVTAPGKGVKKRLTIKVHPVDDPDVRRFNLGVEVAVSGSFSFESVEEARHHQLASAAFSVPGVAGIFGMTDTFTIRKQSSASWDKLEPAIKKAVREAAKQ